MATKEEILRAAGYSYNFDRMAYINRETKKVFAVESVEDNSEDWLARRIAAPNPTGEWQFYDEPTIAVKTALVAELEHGRYAHR